MHDNNAPPQPLSINKMHSCPLGLCVSYCTETVFMQIWNISKYLLVNIWKEAAKKFGNS